MTLLLEPHCLCQSLCVALLHIRMQYPAWVFSLSTSSDSCDAFLPDLQLVHEDMFYSFNNVLLLIVLNHDDYLNVQHVIG